MTETVIILSDKAQAIMATPAHLGPMPTIEDIVSIRGVEKRWFVVHTKPQVEHKVAKRLEEIGAEAYAPETVEWKPRTRAERDQKKPLEPVTRPLMPRYILAKVPHAGAAISMVQDVDGVLDVLGAGENRTPVPTPVVEFLKEREEAGAFNKTVKRGRVVAPTWAVAGLEVLIKSGPLASFTAIIKDCLKRHRVKTTVNIFGRDTEVEFDIADLVAPST